MAARTLPFIVYLSFLTLGQVIPWFASTSPQQDGWMSQIDLWLYPIKTIAVIALLIYFWPQYWELKDSLLKGPKEAVLTLAVGMIVYAAWVRMDWMWAMQGNGTAVGYDPFQAGPGTGLFLAGIRLFGASAVVPIMEELFWRSFLLRYLISPKFDTVALGTFTLFSFAATVVLFGLEHDLWLAGMLAGAAYSGLLYYTKRLWPCIVAHAITNLALGIHVLVTGEWRWW